jgi:hypothetical protein
MLPDREPDPRPQGNDVAMGEALQKTLLYQEPNPPLQGDEVALDGGQAADRAPDEVEGAPPYMTERQVGPTVGITVNRAADAAQHPLPPIIKGKGTAITMSPAALSVAMVMVLVVVALGLIEFLFRRTYSKRVLAFGAMRLSQPPPDHVRPIDLPWPARNQVEPDPSAASSLESVKKTLDAIEEAVADMASSRRLRRPS